MQPYRDTMKLIPHLGYSTLEGLAYISGGYRHTFVFLLLAPVPSLEIIHLSTLPNLSTPWLSRRKYQPSCCFLCCCCFFFNPAGAVNCLFYVKGHCQQLVSLRANLFQHWCLKYRTACLLAASHHSLNPGPACVSMSSNVAQHVSPSSPFSSQNEIHF